MGNGLEGLTENLYYKVLEEHFKSKNKISEKYYLFECLISFVKRPIIELDLDKSYFAMESYVMYDKYENFKLKPLYVENGKKDDKFCLNGSGDKSEIVLHGDALNSFNNVFKKYISDLYGIDTKFLLKKTWEKNYLSDDDKPITAEDDNVYGFEYNIIVYKKGDENGVKAEISVLANMYFYLTTTIGNFMPWPKNFNPVPGNGLDIFQEKFSMYLNLYEWMRMVGKLDEDWECWIKGFVDDHYLQEFVNDDKTEALRFLNLDKIEEVKNEIKEKKEDIEKAGEKEKEELHKKIEELEKVWNLYFYRASKAIMKRSYRILKNKEIKDGKLSEEQENEFNKKFQEFCEECNVMEELVGLIKKLDKNDNTDNEGGKPEMLELDELIKKLDNLIEQL